MKIDVTQLRKESPGCNQLLYMNHVEKSLMPLPVLNVIQDYLKLETEIGSVDVYNKTKAQVNATYQLVSKLINCSSSDVALIENTSTTLQLLGHSLELKKGDKILTTNSESNTHYLSLRHLAKSSGAKLETITVKKDGKINIAAFKKQLTNRVKLVVISHISGTTGIINPVKKLCSLSSNHKCITLIDADYSLGHIPIDVSKLNCDILISSGHKYLRSNQGLGILYIKQSVRDVITPLFLDPNVFENISEKKYEIQNTMSKFESNETSTLSKLILGTATAYLLKQNQELMSQRITYLSHLLQFKLENISSLSLITPHKNESGIICFKLNKQCSKNVISLLRETRYNDKHIAISIAKTYQKFDILRISIHYFNTEEEMDIIAQTLESILLNETE